MVGRSVSKGYEKLKTNEKFVVQCGYREGGVILLLGCTQIRQMQMFG